jgi:hypothetical protein
MEVSSIGDPGGSLIHLKEVEVQVLSPMDSIMVINEIEEHILPPVDRGQRAWALIFGAFMIEGLLYGKTSTPSLHLSV